VFTSIEKDPKQLYKYSVCVLSILRRISLPRTFRHKS